MYVHVQTWGEVAGPSEERTGGDGGLGIEERSTAAASSASLKQCNNVMSHGPGALLVS